jgi:antitoxin component YwqK of YwqJK toxin-antitoxin module
MNGAILTGKDTLTYYKKYKISADSSNFSLKVTSTAKCAVPASIFSNNDAVVLKHKKISIKCSNDTFYVIGKPTGGTVKWYRNGINVGNGDFYHAKQKGNYNAVYINSGCNSDSSNKISLMSVGIKDGQSLVYGRLYPNPVKDWLNWDSKSDGMLEIWSMNGQKCMQQIVEVNKSYKLNVSHLAKGIYTVRLKNDENIFYIDQIVIQ